MGTIPYAGLPDGDYGRDVELIKGKVSNSPPPGSKENSPTSDWNAVTFKNPAIAFTYKTDFKILKNLGSDF